MNVTSKLCQQCSQPIGPERRKFCSQKCALKWHNAQIPWSEKPGRNAANARARDRYWQDPEVMRAKQRKWRERNPESHMIHIRQAKLKNAEAIKQQSAEWRARNREHLKERSALLYYQTREKTPWKAIVRSAFRRAMEKGLEFNLTVEWAKARWTGFCEVTGIPFVLTNTKSGFYSPSIDRIEASKGYTQNNCRFALFSVNSFKGPGTDEDMRYVAQFLLKRRPE